MERLKKTINNYFYNFLFQYLPEPIPPSTLLSAVTTVGGVVLCGAILGKYKQANPSALMSNSTNGGKVQEPWALKSLGVVMDTKVLIRVRGTGPPLGLFGSISSREIQHKGSPKRKNSLKKRRRGRKLKQNKKRKIKKKIVIRSTLIEN